MAESRDDLLNELIEYYDAANAKNTESEAAVESEAEDELGKTRVVSKAPIPPPEEKLGDTVVVSIKKKPEPEKPKVDSLGDTTRITPPVSNNNIESEKQPVPAETPVEEVFGQMGIDGKPVSPQSDTKTEPAPKKAEDTVPQRRKRASEVTAPDLSSEEDTEEEGDSLWHMLKPLWVTLIISAIVAAGFKFYVTDTGIIGTYKRNFEYNMSVLLDLFGIDIYSDIGSEPVSGEQTDSFVTLADNDVLELSDGTDISESDVYDVSYSEVDNPPSENNAVYKDIDGGTVIVPFDGADSSDFSAYNGGVVCAKSNYICFYNEKGELKWEYDNPVTSPIVSTAGKYVAVASRDSTRLCVYENGSESFSLDTDDNIVSCDISERGDVLLVTDKPAYKGAVVVYNKKGEKIFSWSSGANYITAATMLKTRLAAVSLVSASDSVTSYVMIFDVKSPDPLSGIELEGTMLFEADNNGKHIFVTGDNCIASINADSQADYDLRFDDVYLTHSANDYFGNRLITYTRNNSPVIAMYSRNGELNYSATVDSTPDSIDVYKNTILYNNGRQIVCGSRASDKRSRYTAPMAVDRLVLLSSRSYMIVYDNSLEFVKL